MAIKTTVHPKDATTATTTDLQNNSEVQTALINDAKGIENMNNLTTTGPDAETQTITEVPEQAVETEIAGSPSVASELEPVLTPAVAIEASPSASGTHELGKVYQLSLTDINTNPANPRTLNLKSKTSKCGLGDEDLDDLAASIKSIGLCHPIIVQDTPAGVMIVAGERRYRAAKKAELTEIPVMFTAANPALVTIIENLQRVDLTGIQEAEALDRLRQSDPKTYTTAYIGQLIGKHANSITEKLKVATLPLSVRDEFRDEIKCSSALLRLARQTYDRELKDSGVTTDTSNDPGYAKALLEYIKRLLDSEKTANQLRDARKSARKTVVPASKPAGKEPTAPELNDNASAPTPENRDNDSGGIVDAPIPIDSAPVADDAVANTLSEVITLELDSARTGVVATTTADSMVKAARDLRTAYTDKLHGITDLTEQRLIIEQILPEESRVLVVTYLSEILNLLGGLK